MPYSGESSSSPRDFIICTMASEKEHERFRLQNEFAAAIAEVTLAMNEQFLAVIGQDSDISRFDVKIADAIEKRNRAKNAMLDHIERYGW